MLTYKPSSRNPQYKVAFVNASSLYANAEAINALAQEIASQKLNAFFRSKDQLLVVSDEPLPAHLTDRRRQLSETAINMFFSSCMRAPAPITLPEEDTDSL